MESSFPLVGPEDAHRPAPRHAALRGFQAWRVRRRAMPPVACRRADPGMAIREPNARKRHLSPHDAGDLLHAQVLAVHGGIPRSARRSAPSDHRGLAGSAGAAGDREPEQGQCDNDTASAHVHPKSPLRRYLAELRDSVIGADDRVLNPLVASQAAARATSEMSVRVPGYPGRGRRASARAAQTLVRRVSHLPHGHRLSHAPR